MKLLEIDYNYYYYPKDINCIKAFIEYANRNYNSFMRLTCLETDNCVFPYLISEDSKDIYVNVSAIKKITETEATVLSRSEYDAKLSQVIKSKCLDCVNYEEDSEGDNLKGHRERLSLDGICWAYHKKD